MTSTLRKNGQAASCEPCRKSKYRCDHGHPTCARCVRRGMAAKCSYHPAPMTRERHASRRPESLGRSLQSPTSITTTETPSTAGAHTDPTTVSRSPSPPGAHGRSSPACATGFVGMRTAFNAFTKVDDAPRAFAALSRGGLIPSNQSFQASHTELVEGIALLEFLLDLPADTNSSMQDWIGTTDCCVMSDNPIATPVIVATGRALDGIRVDPAPDRTQRAARAIFENTAQPCILPRNNDAVEQEFTAKPRWECIALYCAGVAEFIGADQFSRLQSTGNAKGRITAIRQLFAFLMQCEAVCERMGQVNDLTLSQMLAGFILSSWCFGDNSYISYRTMGICQSVASALGLHTGCEGDGTLPPYVVQARRCNMALLYTNDISQATFVGRPPRISKHFYTIELPLDLHASEYKGSPERIQCAQMTLTPDGWKLDKSITAASNVRASAILCRFREEALELIIGPDVPDEARKASSILSNLKTTWQSLSHLQINSNITADNTDIHIANLGYLTLDYLYTVFLLEKTLVSLTGRHRADLIETSHSILSRVLAVAKSKRMLASHVIGLEWTVVFFAMPTASVLLLELFRQSRCPQRSNTLNRATIVKDISALIWCCDLLIESGHANYDIIKQAQSIFSRGLDEILNAADQPSYIMSQVQADGGQSQPMTDGIDTTAPDLLPQDPEWTAWLESYGLDMDPWLNNSAEQSPLDFGMDIT